jgi:hypothetical protein
LMGLELNQKKNDSTDDLVQHGRREYYLSKL